MSRSYTKQIFALHLDQIPVAVGTLLALGVYVQTFTFRVPGQPKFTSGDHLKYIQMAEGAQCSIAPFCWRILNPLLVRWFPLPLAESFMTLALASLTLSGVLVYEIAKAYGFQPRTAVVGTALFVNLSWASGYYLWNFWLTDPLGYVFTLLAIYAIFTERDWLFLVALLVGVSAKESVLFVVPLYYTFTASELIDWDTGKRLIGLTIPAVIVLLSIRMAIKTGDYSLIGRFQNIGIPRLIGLDAGFLVRMVAGTFGFLIIFPSFGLRKTIPTLYRFFPFLILVYVQLLVAVNVERLVVLGFPALIILSLEGLSTLTDELSDLGSKSVSVFPYLLPCFVVFLINLGSRKPISLATESMCYIGFTILIAIVLFAENLIQPLSEEVLSNFEKIFE